MKIIYLDLSPAYIPFLVQCSKATGEKVDPTADNLIIYADSGADAVFDSTQITGSPFDPAKINAKTGLWGVLVPKSAFTAGKWYIALWEMTVDGVTTPKVERYFTCNTSQFTVGVLPAQIAAGVLDATVTITDGAALTIKQGDIKLYTFEFGAQWDCTGGKKIFFTVKKKATDPAASISKECTVTTPATAAGSLSLIATDTASLEVGEYVYEFKRRDADGVSNPGTIQEGKFIIGQDLT